MSEEEVTKTTEEEVIVNEVADADTDVVTADDESASPTGNPEGPSLGLVDIKNAIAVIDHAANEGAFKGWNTIGQIMNVRAKLAAFVDAATPQEVKDAEAAAAAEAKATADADETSETSDEANEANEATS